MEYETGEDVQISGTATADANLTLIVIFNSTTLYETNFTAEGDGNYSEEYEIPGNATDGIYSVTVSDGGDSVSADFTVASDNSMELAETLIEQAEDAKDNVEDAACARTKATTTLGTHATLILRLQQKISSGFVGGVCCSSYRTV